MLLEQSVAEAQQTENNFKEFQDWLDGMDAQLTARINNDTDANDIPEDVQVGFCSAASLLVLNCLRFSTLQFQLLVYIFLVGDECNMQTLFRFCR